MRHNTSQFNLYTIYLYLSLPPENTITIMLFIVGLHVSRGYRGSSTNKGMESSEYFSFTFSIFIQLQVESHLIQR
uniref:Uncharacterized protein n=1 Tax=Daphnia magna TaxID=35525 RepID=A0A0P6J3M8_9CRUS